MSKVRTQAAEATKDRVLRAAKALFVRRGIDRTTIAEIADKAVVSVPTVYALYKSKEGILRELMKRALFGQGFEAAQAKLSGVGDPVRLLALTAHVARAIYEAESSELGLLRGASAFSPELRKLEQEFENMRFAMQEKRIRLLFAQSKQRRGLELDEARRVLWMYTSRDVHRMLVREGGWTPERYQEWLSDTIVNALVDTRWVAAPLVAPTAVAARPASRVPRRVGSTRFVASDAAREERMSKGASRSPEVDAYIATQPPATKDALEALRSCIWEAAPGVSELMNYNIPAFALVKGGKRDKQIMIAGYSRHVGFYPHPDTIDAFADQLADYKSAKGSVQFPLDRPIPRKLVIAMVKHRLSQLQE